MIQPMGSKKILMLDGRSDHYWLEVLQGAMSTLDGALEMVGEAGIQHIPWRDYDLVILDASVFSDLPSIISWIRSQDPEARIVVFSPAPAWKQAREVMLAGAIDYACKSLDREYILSTLKKNLARQAPSWQHQG
jgi:DNA-binding NarL/FixJ family response regulator